MNERAVVSCPRCIRQYEVDAGISQIVAQCGVCKAHFAIAIPRLTGPIEDALVLDREIEFCISFFTEACQTMGKNVCELLVAAGSPVTPQAVTAIVKSIPRDVGEIRTEEWRSDALGKALYRALHSHDNMPLKLEMLFDYFLKYIPDRTYLSQDMLRAAFEGVLGGIAWPDSGTQKASTPTKTSRFKLFTWLRRRAADRILLAHASRSSSKSPIS